MLSYRSEDGEIELRLPRSQDAEAHVALLDANREHLGKWLPWAREARTLEQERVAIRRLRLAHANEEGLSFAIWVRAAFAGITGLYDINAHAGTASLGFWLGEAFVGKGIITRASSAILQHAFEVLGLERIDADPHVDNPRSIATLERLGFVREGTHRGARILDSQHHDVCTYALLADDWRRRAQRS